MKPSPKSKSLPAAAIRELGKTPDTQVAKKFKVPLVEVARQRRERGIPNHRHCFWTTDRIALLGTASDAEVAGMIGVTKSAVFSKRVSLGIAPVTGAQSERVHKWTASQERKLGTVSDNALAEKFGISTTVVNARRLSMGIAPARTMALRKPWTKKELALLGKHADNYVSISTGRGRRHVRSKRVALGIAPFQHQVQLQWTAKLLKRLGTKPDSELANELGQHPNDSTKAGSTANSSVPKLSHRHIAVKLMRFRRR